MSDFQELERDKNVQIDRCAFLTSCQSVSYKPRWQNVSKPQFSQGSGEELSLFWPYLCIISYISTNHQRAERVIGLGVRAVCGLITHHNAALCGHGGGHTGAALLPVDARISQPERLDFQRDPNLRGETTGIHTTLWPQQLAAVCRLSQSGSELLHGDPLPAAFALR